MSKSWTDKIRPILVFAICIIVMAFDLHFFGEGGEHSLGMALALIGATLMIVDAEVKKLQTKLDTLETPSTPPGTEEA